MAQTILLQPAWKAGAFAHWFVVRKIENALWVLESGPCRKQDDDVAAVANRFDVRTPRLPLHCFQGMLMILKKTCIN